MKTIAPHEPTKALLSAEEAFADASASEKRWQVFDAEQGLKRIFIDLPDPLYHTLERLAQQRQQSVPMFVEHVLEDLVTTFAPAI